MDMSYIEYAKQFIGDYWPHISGVVVPAVATVVFAHIRRPKSAARDTGPYFAEAELMTPPLVRPAYSDRMAYVLAEMSDLAYYQFEGQGGFIEDAVQNALELNLAGGQDIRQFLDRFSTDLMSGRRLSLEAFGNVLANSGFALVEVIDIRETQGFVCRRNVDDEPPYLVLAFRGTEKKISDWLTDARCVPTVEGKTRVHTGFLRRSPRMSMPREERWKRRQGRFSIVRRPGTTTAGRFPSSSPGIRSAAHWPCWRRS